MIMPRQILFKTSACTHPDVGEEELAWAGMDPPRCLQDIVIQLYIRVSVVLC
jgi:hypothetical protein